MHGPVGLEGAIADFVIILVASVIVLFLSHRLRLSSIVGLVATGAASVPAWLDGAITEWNQENPDVQIQFVDLPQPP